MHCMNITKSIFHADCKECLQHISFDQIKYGLLNESGPKSFSNANPAPVGEFLG